jgi:hypothetical protein
MKYDIKRLRKIDWTRLTLDPVDAIALSVGFNATSVFIYSKETTVVILQKERDSEWKTNDGARFMPERHICSMFRRAIEVDRFITRELAEIEKREAVPSPGDGFELCDEKDATWWTYRSPYCRSIWCSIWAAINSVPPDTERVSGASYAFRRPPRNQSRYRSRY